MIDNFNKKEMFDNYPVEGMPDELYEVAYRYAALESERDFGKSLAVKHCRKINFKDFIVCNITWSGTLEGHHFWNRLHHGQYHPELSRIRLDKLKHFIDFKPFK